MKRVTYGKLSITFKADEDKVNGNDFYEGLFDEFDKIMADIESMLKNKSALFDIEVTEEDGVEKNDSLQ